MPTHRVDRHPVPRAGATRSRRPATAMAILVLAVAAFLASLGPAGPAGFGPGPAEAAAYDRFYSDFQGEELMRVVNADRRAHGLAAIAADPVLIAIARDRAFTCPSDASLTIRGRARDMADRAYFSHAAPGCSYVAKTGDSSNFNLFDMLILAGYPFQYNGETIAWNNDGVAATSYLGLSGVPLDVANAETTWRNSTAHWPIISGTWNRFGCAAWQDGSGKNLFVCTFANGGTSATDTTAPLFSNVSGQSATYPVGSTPTFTATVTDSQVRLSDGYVTLDGTVLREWAYDHGSSTANLSVTLPALAAGVHTLVWWIRDVATNARSTSVTFTAGDIVTLPPTAPPTPSPTPRPTPAATPTTAPTSPPGPTAGPTSTPSPAGSTPSPGATAGDSATPGSPAAATPGPSSGGTPSVTDAAPTTSPAATATPAGADPGASTAGAPTPVPGQGSPTADDRSPVDAGVVAALVVLVLGAGALALRSRGRGV